jgi:excisionase family DNA binding protein
MKHKDLISAYDAALIFGVDPRTIDRWAKLGRLPYFLTAGGHRRFSRAELEKIKAEQTQATYHFRKD